ncbi:MAG: CHRD domain-containing protein [Planctomycetota bacterium]
MMLQFRNIIQFATAFALAAVCITTNTNAQIQFGADINGANVVPPTASTVIGRSWFNYDEASNQLWFRVETKLLTGGILEFRTGPAGANGPILFTTTSAGPEYQGVSPVLTTANATDLFNSELYVQVVTPGFPGGEIRGQIERRVERQLIANLTGPGAAVGTARITVIQPEGVVLYRVEASGLSSAPTAAAVRLNPGMGGTVLFPLVQLPAMPSWRGASLQLGAGQIQQILAGNCVVQVQTVNFPGGELSGPLVPEFNRFYFTLNGTNVIPANGSPNSGRGEMIYNPATNQITYNIDWNGGASMGAFLHIDTPFSNGVQILVLAGGAAGPWIGVTPPLFPAAYDALFEGRLYVEIRSAAVPTGEIRGQVTPNPDVYGYAGATSAGNYGRILRIATYGLPLAGNPNYEVACFDALPGSFCSLAYGEDTAGMPLDLTFAGITGHVLWTNPLAGYPAAADATGYASNTFAIPPVAALIGQDFYLQWLSIDVAANPLGLVTSDAVKILIQ